MAFVIAKASYTRFIRTLSTPFALLKAFVLLLALVWECGGTECIHPPEECIH